MHFRYCAFLVYTLKVHDFVLPFQGGHSHDDVPTVNYVQVIWGNGLYFLLKPHYLGTHLSDCLVDRLQLDSEPIFRKSYRN